MNANTPQAARSFPASSMHLPDALGQVTRALKQIRELQGRESYPLEESQLDQLSQQISQLSALVPFHFGADAEISRATQGLRICGEKIKRLDA